MQAVEKDQTFRLINPRTNIITNIINAKKLFKKIAHSAWKNGEPGVLFIDTINTANPTPLIGKMKGTNPCGEHPFITFEVCVLGLFNVSKMVKQNSGH